MAIEEITVDELDELLAAPGVAVLDVRNPDEFEEARVPGVALIPLSELEQRVDEVPDAAALYVICRSGARSAKAAELLAQRGITAVNVAGGTMAWIESSRSVDSGPAS